MFSGIPSSVTVDVYQEKYANKQIFEHMISLCSLDQLCELVAEEDLELVTALVQWDFEDEMEDEDDEHGMIYSLFRRLVQFHLYLYDQDSLFMF